ncbi:complex I 24 kDa subunit family protein [Coprothermobacter platensis]|uniref:NADH-quinone oxidoreductase subunit NuoE family protein n=1 Tax=Coprothermobacter platensis TaxID=108819 RepID=UPI0003773790|nr:NAD(P)H-dependent oxidoreductase subunit E [Coprothermobacter platensis]
MEQLYELFGTDRVEEFRAKLDELKNVPGSMISILNEAQEIFGYVPFEVQELISRETGVPLTEIFGIVTFYSRFSIIPAGKYKISLCLGTACYVKGSGQILEKLEEKLGIKEGNTTSDGMFSLSAARCLGACALAPVMMINGEVYGRLTPDSAVKVIEKIKQQDLSQAASEVE